MLGNVKKIDCVDWLFVEEGKLVFDKNKVTLYEFYYHSDTDVKTIWDGNYISTFKMCLDYNYKFELVYKANDYEVIELYSFNNVGKSFYLGASAKRYPVCILVRDNTTLHILDTYFLEYYIDPDFEHKTNHYRSIAYIERRLAEIVKVFKGNMDLIARFFNYEKRGSIDLLGKDECYINFRFSYGVSNHISVNYKDYIDKYVDFKIDYTDYINE